MSKVRISRHVFVGKLMAEPSAFCGLVHTIAGQTVSDACINAIRITALNCAPRKVKAVSTTAVTFDDDSNILIDFKAHRECYMHDDDLLEIASTEYGSDITKHLFYSLSRDKVDSITA